jgi:FkbM family methyltransferase
MKFRDIFSQKKRNLDGIDFVTDSDLEKHRADTLLTKEPETIFWIDSWDDTNNITYFDIGANIGVYSVYAAKRKKNIEVISFEPDPKNFVSLIKNVELNEISKIVLPLSLAVDNEDGITNFTCDDNRTGRSGGQIRKNLINALYSYRVFALSLDTLVLKCNFPEPTHVKIDIDGRENNVLKGMKKIFELGIIKTLLIEFNNSEEKDFWTHELKKYGLKEDLDIRNLRNHSSERRKLNNSTAINVVFRGSSNA